MDHASLLSVSLLWVFIYLFARVILEPGEEAGVVSDQ